MNQSLFQRLRTLVAFRFDSFEKRLGELRSAHYPSLVALEFIDQLTAELRRGRRRMRDVLSDFSVDAKHAGLRLRSHLTLLEAKLPYLESLENAQTQAVPWSLVPSIERLASQLIPGKRLLTTSTHELNYGISWYGVSRTPIEQYLILEIPAIYKTNALLHILVGHELLHPILDDFLNSEWPAVAKRLIDYISADSQLMATAPLGELFHEAGECWQQAIRELMCDMGCAAIFGPAALLAHFAFELGSDLDEPPSAEGYYYPPLRYRFREVLHYVFEEPIPKRVCVPKSQDQKENEKPLGKLCVLLEKGPFEWAAAFLKEEFDIVKKEVVKETDSPAIAHSALVKIAYHEVRNSLPKAWEYVREKIESLGLLWLTTMEDIPSLLKKLDLLVPPGEILVPPEETPEKQEHGAKTFQTRSPSLSAIAIATWLCQLKDEESATEVTEDKLLKDYHRLCRLMLKAFEDVELRREYDSRKNNSRIHDRTT